MGLWPNRPRLGSTAEGGGAPDADLQAVIDAWHTLPEPIRAGIVAMVKAAEKGS